MGLHVPIHGCFRSGDPADCSQLACSGVRLVSQISRGACSQLKDTTRKPLLDCLWGVWCASPRGANSSCWGSADLGGKDHSLHENFTLRAFAEGHLQLGTEKMMHKEAFSSGSEKRLRTGRRDFARERLSLTIKIFLKLKLQETCRRGKSQTSGWCMLLEWKCYEHFSYWNRG